MARAAGYKVFDYNLASMKVWAGYLGFANTTVIVMRLESNGGDMYRIKNSKVGILNEHQIRQQPDKIIISSLSAVKSNINRRSSTSDDRGTSDCMANSKSILHMKYFSLARKSLAEVETHKVSRPNVS
jgi:hypothetical protein